MTHEQIDYVPSYDEDGNLRQRATATPNFQEVYRQGEPIEGGGGSVDGEDIAPASVSTGEINNILHPQTASEIKTALEDSPAGTQVVIPHGTYNVDNPITITNHISVRGTGTGQGSNGTALNKTNDAPVIVVDDAYPDIRGIQLVTDMDDTTPGLKAVAGSSGPLFLSHVEVEDMGSHGIHLEFGNLAGVQNINVADNAGDGLRIEGSNNNNAGVYLNINAQRNGGHGVYNAGYGNFIQGYAHASGKSGLYMADGSNGGFFIFGAEGSADDSVTIADGARGVHGHVTFGSFTNNGKRSRIWHIGQPHINLYEGLLQTANLDISAAGVPGAWEFRQADNSDLEVNLPIDASADFRWQGTGYGGSQFINEDGDFETTQDGDGLVVADADGSGDRYRIRVNGGNIEAEGPL